MGISAKLRYAEGKNYAKDVRKNAFEIAKVIRDLWDNREFMSDAELCGNVLERRNELLDELCEGLNYSALEMKHMIKKYPEDKDWAHGKLTNLYTETMKSLKDAEQASKKPRSEQREPPTRKEYDALESRLARSAEKLKQQTDELAENKARIAEEEAKRKAAQEESRRAAKEMAEQRRRAEEASELAAKEATKRKQAEEAAAEAKKSISNGEYRPTAAARLAKIDKLPPKSQHEELRKALEQIVADCLSELEECNRRCQRAVSPEMTMPHKWRDAFRQILPLWKEVYKLAKEAHHTMRDAFRTARV